MPMAVIARPRFTTRALASPAAQQLRAARLPVEEAATLPSKAPPAWVFIQERLDPDLVDRLKSQAECGVKASIRELLFLPELTQAAVFGENRLDCSSLR